MEHNNKDVFVAEILLVEEQLTKSVDDDHIYSSLLEVFELKYGEYVMSKVNWKRVAFTALTNGSFLMFKQIVDNNHIDVSLDCESIAMYSIESHSIDGLYFALELSMESIELNLLNFLFLSINSVRKAKDNQIVVFPGMETRVSIKSKQNTSDALLIFDYLTNEIKVRDSPFLKTIQTMTTIGELKYSISKYGLKDLDETLSLIKDRKNIEIDLKTEAEEYILWAHSVEPKKLRYEISMGHGPHYEPESHLTSILTNSI